MSPKSAPGKSATTWAKKVNGSSRQSTETATFPKKLKNVPQGNTRKQPYNFL